MTYIFNDPKQFPSEAVDGLVAAHSDDLIRVHGGVVRKNMTPPGQPALVVGGGSGHYPAFAGWVGQGFAHGSPCGNIFSSPSSDQIYSVAKNAENGGGVIFGFGNYAGDVLHFGVAAEKLRAEGVDVRIIKVSDDIASNSEENHRDRRGIAGDFTVFKIAGAAIDEGSDIDQVERVAWKANDATRSLGLAFDGCTLPGAQDALFHVPDHTMALGLGIHGEPGIKEMPMGDATTIAQILVDGVLAETPELSSDRIAVIVNGLGTVKYEEMFVLYQQIEQLLRSRGLSIIAPIVDEQVTSLDMAGVSLTVMYLDDELERLWLAPAMTPAFTRLEHVRTGQERQSIYQPGADEIPAASDESRAAAARVGVLLDAIAELMRSQEEELGRLDAIAADGDHGQGMVLGSGAASRAATAVIDKGAGVKTALVQAGAAWSAVAGGTSGALWGAAITAAGAQLSDDSSPVIDDVRRALIAGVEAIERLGGAVVGDKTMVDAAVPFRDSLADAASSGTTLREAAEQATVAARATADLTPRKGRARVLADKSHGTPDPGALSFAMIVTLIAEQIESHDR